MARAQFTPWRRRVASVLAIPGLTLVPALVAARAGGGGDFSPGDGDGGGGGDGALLYLALRLVIWAFTVHPLFGLAMLCAVAGGGALMKRSGSREVTRRSVRREQAARYSDGARLEADLDALRRRDTRFDPVRFVERVTRGFVRVQEAWSAGDLRPVRPLLSDGVWNRFHTLLALDRAQGRRNVIGRPTLDSVRIIAAVAGDDFDELHVRIAAVARDIHVPAGATRPGIEAALGRAKPAPFVEIWSFLRRAGATTRSQRGVLEGACPSCGATLAIADVVECEHCATLVNSGSHDWVLAEITQEVTWSGASTHAVPGLDALKERDPNTSRQALEDRSSLLFWRWLESKVIGDVARLHKVVAPAMLARLRQTHAQPAPLTRAHPRPGPRASCRRRADRPRSVCRVVRQVRWPAVRD